MKNLRTIMITLACFFSTGVFATAMDLNSYIATATNTDINVRCIGGISSSDCKAELDYGLSKGLITQRAYQWGIDNGYYPVINRHDVIGAICKCGCFEADTNISVWSQEAQQVVNVSAKDINKKHHLIALTTDATLTAMNTESFTIKSLTQGAEKAALYVFTLEDGTQLKVSQHHGMLLSTGEMVAAKDVTSEQSFISASSQAPLKITEISREFTDKDVFNFETESNYVANHIIVANNIYVGDLIWQNQLEKDLGAIAIRQ